MLNKVQGINIFWKIPKHHISSWFYIQDNTKGLILCSKKEILWVESHDLSQTDNSYNSVFFSKVEWWVVELLFVSLNNWGLNFLQNEFSQSSQIYLSQEKLRKMFTFSILKWLFAELSKMTTIFTQNSPWMSFEWKVVSFCEFAQLCKQLFLSKLEKNHVTQLTGFSSQNTKWGSKFISGTQETFI